MQAAEHKRFLSCYRLSGATQFSRVFKQARRFSCAGFTILIRSNNELAPRLGLIVSKKCARKAVQRNRIKRQIRESFRHIRNKLGNFDIVVIAKPLLTDKANQHINNRLKKHWLNIELCVE